MATHLFQYIEVIPRTGTYLPTEVETFVKENELPFIISATTTTSGKRIIFGLSADVEYRRNNVMQGIRFEDDDIIKLAKVLPKGTIVIIRNRLEGHSGTSIYYKVSETGKLREQFEIGNEDDIHGEDILPNGYASPPEYKPSVEHATNDAFRKLTNIWSIDEIKDLAEDYAIKEFERMKANQTDFQKELPF